MRNKQPSESHPLQTHPRNTCANSDTECLAHTNTSTSTHHRRWRARYGQRARERDWDAIGTEEARMMEHIMRITGRFMQPFIELPLVVATPWIPKPNHLFQLHTTQKALDRTHTQRHRNKRKHAHSHAVTEAEPSL